MIDLREKINKEGASFQDLVRLGLVDGWELISNTSRSIYIGTTFTDVWSNPFNMIFATANESWEIFCLNANDANGGSGAWVGVVTYVDSDFVKYTIEVPLNGGTVVLPAGGGAYYDILDFRIKGTGDNANRGKNIGAIILRVTGSSGDDTKVRATILADEGHAFNSQVTVPKGKFLLPISTGRWSTKGQDNLIRFQTQEGGVGQWDASVITSNYQNSDVIALHSPPLPEGTRIVVEARTSNAMAETSGSFNYYLVDSNLVNL